MKTLVPIILALGVGFAAAYVVVSKQKDAELEKLKAQPPVVAETVIAEPVEKVVMVSTPAAPAMESAQDILNDLLNVSLGSGSARNAGLRLVVFKLHSLSERNDLAVPAIREFIGRNVDVDYSQTGSTTSSTVTSTNQADANNRGWGRGSSRGDARRARNIETLQADWVVPPSLRLGLVSTLKEIGSEGAEVALAEMLNTTGRGVEVAYLAVVLEELAPGKYREAAVGAAKELLMNPPAIDSPDRLDSLAKSYLYGVLVYFKDTSFAINAQQLLVGQDGKLDLDAMDYLATVLKDQSVSALYAAYQNPALTDQFDKMRIGREVLNYVGQNSQANALFTDTLNNPEIDSRVKAFTIMQLAGGVAGGDMGPFESAVPTDPQVAANRIGLLNSLSSQYASDPTLSKLIPAVVEALQKNKPVQQDVMRNLMGGGRRGGPPNAN